MNLQRLLRRPNSSIPHLSIDGQPACHFLVRESVSLEEKVAGGLRLNEVLAGKLVEELATEHIRAL
jgi:hypothetical protein